MLILTTTDEESAKACIEESKKNYPADRVNCCRFRDLDGKLYYHIFVIEEDPNEQNFSNAS